MKRGTKVKLEVAKPPSALKFSENLLGGRGISIYAAKLSEAISADAAIRVMADDHYMRHQLRAQAKKMKLRLVFAIEGEYLWVRPLLVEGEQKRLLLWLREPRTLNELHAKGLELDIDSELQRLVRAGLVVLQKGQYHLTGEGMKLVAA